MLFHCNFFALLDIVLHWIFFFKFLIFYLLKFFNLKMHYYISISTILILTFVLVLLLLWLLFCFALYDLYFFAKGYSCSIDYLVSFQLFLIFFFLLNIYLPFFSLLPTIKIFFRVEKQLNTKRIDGEIITPWISHLFIEISLASPKQVPNNREKSLRTESMFTSLNRECTNRQVIKL